MQFARASEWEKAGNLALVGMGVEPGMSNVFARYAAEHLGLAEIDEIGVRDGSNITVDGYDFAPNFSVWTVLEECLNPPIVYDHGRIVCTEPFSGEGGGAAERSRHYCTTTAGHLVRRTRDL